MTQPVDTEPVAEIGVATAVLTAAETAVATYMLGAYVKWLAQVSVKVLAGFVKFGLSPDPTAVWATVPMWTGMIDELVDDLVRLARKGWEDATRQLVVPLPFDPFDPILADQLQRTRNLMVRTPDEVYRIIVGELSRGAMLNENTAQLASRVRHALDVTGVENWPARARTVATTEVHRVYNMGALAAGLRASTQVPGVTKTWIAKDDGGTRPAHGRADGQTVLINQPFIVNMEPLNAPGDPWGSPANVINCRCKSWFRR